MAFRRIAVLMASALLGLWTLGALARGSGAPARCLTDVLDELSQEARQPRPAGASRSPEAIRPEVEKALLAKGLSQEDATAFSAKVLAPGAHDPEALAQIISGLEPGRMKTRFASKVIPRLLREMDQFHPEGELPARALGRVIGEWSDEELAGLSVAYERAAKIAPHAKSVEERLAAFSKVFEKEGAPPAVARKLARCATF